MPIYMDRHDVSATVTAENVAQLHQQDLKIQHQFGCRGLTYWFDDKRKTAFCLIEAPNAGAIEKMHEIAHGQVPHRIIEVHTSIVESFLGRIEDPQKAQNTDLNIIDDPAFRTIMVAEINNLSLKESARVKISLNKYNQAISKLLKKYDGNIVKRNGNYFLVSFKSPTSAVNAALAVQKLFHDLKKTTKAYTFRLKIGLNAGVPVTEKQLIFEDTIKLAQRMCTAINGEIVIAPEVKELYNSENTTALPENKNIFSLTRDDEDFLTRLMDYTELNWNNVNVKVDDLCKALGYSKSQLYRTMILLTKKSPNTFIREYRLNEALLLLQQHSGNISEIAFKTGFSSPSYFSKCFQKKYGIHPSACLMKKAV